MKDLYPLRDQISFASMFRALLFDASEGPDLRRGNSNQIKGAELECANVMPILGEQSRRNIRTHRSGNIRNVPDEKEIKPV